jgi:hypothetical protein
MKYKPSDPVLYQKVKNRVKSRVERWPSAYASGQVVQQYKAEFKKKYGDKNPYKGKKKEKGALARWYEEKWVDLCRPKKDGKYHPCGRKKMTGKYPFCRPSMRVNKNTPMTVDEVIAKFGLVKIKERCERKQKIKKKRMKKLT